MRKPQPFTIGTRLSIPKCPDLSTDRPMPPHTRAPPCGPLVQDAAHPPDSYITEGDHLVRSIRRIALSRRAEEAGLGAWPADRTVHGNCNNNNSRGLRHVTPGAADLPQSVRDPECHRTAKGLGPPGDSVRTSLPDIIQLSREIQQVERWVQCKLQEVTEGGDTSTLQRDLQTYEGSVLQLSQMVDLVTGVQPPAMASVRSQLHTLRDQWQLLKKMAANQNCALGGATALLEFNKKADELEMWMREKEEMPPLHLLLDENLDKVQITRKILDLKQEQIHYCSLQEKINSLAQKLEKLGRPESRAAATRRKHLNRMWLRLQTSLHEHHQTLQWALEAASLGHQSDTILRALEEKSGGAGVRSRDGDHTDPDLRDIGCQIVMLDVAISQVSRLHPLLSSRALHKYQQMKERWARLQQSLREEDDPVTPRPSEQCSVGNQEQSLLGSVAPVCQIKTNSGKSTALSALTPQRHSGQVRGHSQTTSRSATSEPGANHSPQSGHQPPGPPETPEVRHVLQELGSACRWLQGVERLLSEPAAMRSPELIRKDLKHVSQLEREVRARGAALQGLRGNVRKLKTPVTEELKGKVQEVEERLAALQDALPRRVSDLRDSLVLSEFMKVVEMEEERKKKETMTDAAHGDLNAPPTHRIETFTPLEELQEAVEMLNEAAAERERALSATREATKLENRVSALGHMMEAARAKLQDVRSCAEAAEEKFVSVKKETELRDLRGMITLQEEVESDISAVIGPEVQRLKDLQDLHTSQGVRSLEETLRTWTDLQDLVTENRARLQRTEWLRDFFLRYLEMISWAEVTRGQILSECPRGRLSSAQREELERRMGGSLKEFEVLSGIGWRLIGEDHTLSRMIQERLEEVQGLLSWLSLRWRGQKHKRIMGNRAPKMKTREDGDNMEELKVAVGSAALEEFECPDDEDVTPPPAPRGPTLRRYRRRALSPILFQPPPCRPVEEGPQDGPRKCAKGPLWLEPKSLPRGSGSPEPQEEVSVYLNPKAEAQGTYHSLTVPRVSRTTPPAGHSSLVSSSGHSSLVSSSGHSSLVSSSGHSSLVSSSGHSSLVSSLVSSSDSSSADLPKIRSNIFFKSLRRKEKAERCTIQGIMGLYRKTDTKDSTRYQTSTWPPKQEKNVPTPGKNMDRETFVNYVKNPLSRDIDAQCGPGTKEPQPRGLLPSPQEVPSCGPRLTVGSVLTLHISEEPHVLDNIQDTITVIPADDSGKKPKSEKMETEDPSPINGGDKKISGTRAWLEALTSTSGYCRQNIHGYLKSMANAQESRDLENFIENFEVDRLSPIVLRQLDPDWDTHEEALTPPKNLEDASPNGDLSNFQCHSGGVTITCPVLRETRGAATMCPDLRETRGATTTCPVLQETIGATTTCPDFRETRGATTTCPDFRETRGATTSCPDFRETRGATTSCPELPETRGATTTCPDLRETRRATTTCPDVRETRGATTMCPDLRETREATTMCPDLRETEIHATSTSPDLRETGGTTTSSTFFQERGEPAILSTVFQDTRGATTSSTVLRETRGATTTCPDLRETEGESISAPTVLQEPAQSTTSSPILRETLGAFSVKKHSDNGQPAPTFSSDHVIYTREPSHQSHDLYSPMETSYDKRIFSKTNSPPEVLHPDQEFLENDDEELEGIWNNAKMAPMVCHAQAPHNMIPKNMVGGSLSPVKPKPPKVPYGQVVMGSEPNMLVATFTLPTSAMLATESVTEKRPNTWKEKSPSTVPAPPHGHPEEISEGRSVPAPPHGHPEISEGRSVPSPLAPPPKTVEEASMYKVTRRLDFHLMEGSLEKKHVLQVGGRKASSRTWGTFYAVLVRQTLCFYHDHKNSTKRSASAPPLHLTGALCTPESDYTKRDNCFRLRLMDGSEYLFRAPTPESLQQWVTRLRHNSGMEDADLLRGAALASDRSPRIRSLMPDLCQSAPTTIDPPYWKEANTMTAGIPKNNSHHLLPDGADPKNNRTTRKRSQSFSSVVYQRVTSVSRPQDSFSVTLYIDDPLIPRIRCHSFAAPQGAMLSRHTAHLRPQNKSVFRKFFRKKE